jgi:Ca2+-binding RTX toxin-like protein
VRRLLVLVTLAAAMVLVVAPPASAAVTAEFALGVLTVRGDGDANAIAVGCVGGNVDVNGSSPSGGDVACSAVETIIVRAGPGGDRINLSDVTTGTYTDVAEIGAFGEEGNDTLIGSPLADKLDGGGGADTLRGVDGPDVLVAGGGDDALGGHGRDRVSVSGGGYWIVSNDQISHLSPNSESVSMSSIEVVAVTGGPGDDNISTRNFAGPAILRGGDGDDGLASGEANDRLLGGDGNDLLDTSDGSDELFGNDGNDSLRAGAGNDQLIGGRGRDTCVPGPGADSLASCE